MVLLCAMKLAIMCFFKLYVRFAGIYFVIFFCIYLGLGICLVDNDFFRHRHPLPSHTLTFIDDG